MRIGIPAETRQGETRVAATPETVKKLVAAKHQVIVQANIFRIDPPTAGHAQMENHRLPPVRMDQAVFGAAPKTGYGCASQRLDQVNGEWAAQVGPARLNPDEPCAIQIARQSAYGGFDFG